MLKNLGTILATLALMLALAMPPASAQTNDEHPTDTVCLTYPPAVVGCATGTIGSALGACDGNGCDVTLWGNLDVTPVACGWMSWGNLQACAYTAPAHDDGTETISLLPGSYKMESDLCISDPTTTVTVPCTELRHHYVVPATTSNQQNNLPIVVAYFMALLPGELPPVGEPCEGELVYASATFRVYRMDTIC